MRKKKIQREAQFLQNYKHTRDGGKKCLTKVSEGAKVICKHCGVKTEDG